MLKKTKNNKIYKTIRLEILSNSYTDMTLRKNCQYRHFLYNKCVEIVKSLQENHPNGHIGDFNKYDLLGYIRDLYESNIIYSYRDNIRPDWMEDYDYYFRGISECVVDDIMTTINRIIDERSNGELSDIHFMSYNPNKVSFRFKTKVDSRLDKSFRLILTENYHCIGIKINNKQSALAIKLKESINKRYLNLNNIKEIGFNFHNEKWYLNLFAECDPYPEDYVDIRYDHKRKELAGIDLGEKNPVVIYDGKVIKKIPKHLQYPKDKVNKVMNRIKRLQSCMDRKYNPVMDKFHQSKNYYKVLKKFHKAWEHLVNIKKDWHFKLAHWIVTHYKNIVVDEFHDHIVKINDNVNTNKRKRVNHSMNNKAMYNFIRILIHMCHKYGTNYYKVSKSNNKESCTTNTCSRCGNVNNHKLDLDHKIFKCESCGYIIDRDVNAAINCYNLYNNKSTRKLFLELI